MKATHDDTSFLDFPLPLDCYKCITECVDDFYSWLAMVTCAKLPWRDLGGIVPVVEHYVRLHVRSNDMWLFPQPIIKASTYFPPQVFERLRALPWLELMRTLPDERDNMHIAGGYVRVEFLRALRAECPGVVHWSQRIPDKARDVDIWVTRATKDMVRATWHFYDADTHSEARPHSTAWSAHNSILDQEVEFILMNGYYVRDDSKRDRELQFISQEHRALGSYVIPAFDLSCTQFAFKADCSGEVLTTPLALYSIMTGKMVMCNMSPKVLEEQCGLIMTHLSDTMPYDRIVRRIAKYANEYGYTLETFDGDGPRLMELVNKANDAILKDADFPQGIYYNGPKWDDER